VTRLDFVTRIIAAIRLFAYGRFGRLLRCRFGAEQFKRLPLAAKGLECSYALRRFQRKRSSPSPLISFAQGVPTGVSYRYATSFRAGRGSHDQASKDYRIRDCRSSRCRRHYRQRSIALAFDRPAHSIAGDVFDDQSLIFPWGQIAKVKNRKHPAMGRVAESSEGAWAARRAKTVGYATSRPSTPRPRRAGLCTRCVAYSPNSSAR
jgi:hypothetical protein